MLGIIGIIFLLQKGLGPTFVDVAMLTMKVIKTSTIFEIIFLEVLFLKLTLFKILFSYSINIKFKLTK